MAYWIKKVDKGDRHWRVSIPIELIKAMGWDDVTYVVMKDKWGDRILIERLVVDEDAEKKANKGGVGPNRRIV